MLDPAEQAPGAGAIQVSYTSLASGKPTPIFSVVYSITNGMRALSRSTSRWGWSVLIWRRDAFAVSNVWTDSYSTCSTIVTQTVDSESTAVGTRDTRDARQRESIGESRSTVLTASALCRQQGRHLERDLPVAEQQPLDLPGQLHHRLKYDAKTPATS